MEFLVKVVEVTEYERVVVADNYEELKGKIEEDREYVGSYKQERTREVFAEVEDMNGMSYSKVHLK